MAEDFQIIKHKLFFEQWGYNVGTVGYKSRLDPSYSFCEKIKYALHLLFDKIN